MILNWLAVANLLEVFYFYFLKIIRFFEILFSKIDKNHFLGVISEVVGTAEAGPQLQRIVSRCKCEFYYVAYGESSLEGITDRLPRRPEINPW